MRRRSRADFAHKLGVVNGFKVLLIVDLDMGKMSVTNDIENVIDDIAFAENIDPKEYLIAYRDSEGDWDGWDAKTNDFYFFRGPQNEAIEGLKKQISY